MRFWGLAVLCLAAAPVAPAGELNQRAGPPYRSAALSIPMDGRIGFTRVPGSASGILFTNLLSKASGARSQLRLAGSGVTAGDIDADGWCDLYFCGMESGNRLYRNMGAWRFEDITDQAGVRCGGQFSTGAVLADVDGDGDLDLLVNSIGGGTRFFLNTGQGRFQEATDRGLVRKYGATTMAFGDIDGNGTIDLYVTDNNSPPTLADEPNTRFTIQVLDSKPVITAVNGKPVAGTDLMGRYGVSPFDNAIREYGEPDILYLNDGRGRFAPVSWTQGVFSDAEGKPLKGPPRDLGLSVMFRDMNADGAPDIYVCNDLFTPDRIWMNDGHGRFQAASDRAVRSSSAFSMGVDFGDINRDGHDDFITVDMLSRAHQRRMAQTSGMVPAVLRAGEAHELHQIKRNVLHLCRGDGTYAEIAQLSGLDASEWSWTAVLLDVDLDGYEDLLVPAGYDRDSMNGDANAEIERRRTKGNISREETYKLAQLYPRLEFPVLAFRNLRDLRFVEAGKEWGFERSTVKHGMACADLDQDGDLDLITNDLNDEAGVYRNEGIQPRVAVRLKGVAPNTRGIGAKIWLYGGAVPVQSQEMICGGRYLSADDTMRVFAAGAETNRMRIEVRWRSGKRSVVEAVHANRAYEIDETGALGMWEEHKPERKPMFEDVSELIKHTHQDPPFDDFGRQAMLPHTLSQLGPGVSWSDLDGDGREDLLIGSGAGGQLGVFLNQGNRRFQRLPIGTLLGRATSDQTTVLGWALGEDLKGFLVGHANYENGGTNGVKRYELWAGGLQAREVLGTGISSVGPLALGDMDGDGNLELFVGGRANAGRWPEAASSKLYRLQGGGYALDQANSQILGLLGMVSGAVWSDLDNDGYPELILACEWGPVKVYRSENAKLHDVTLEWGLGVYRGWWNAVTVGDFDADGRMDIVASNWGRNSKYEKGRSADHPLRLYYGDWNRNGVLGVMEGYYETGLKKYVPWRGLNSAARGMPWVRERYATHAAYGEAGIEEILGERFKEKLFLEAVWLDSTVFLNRGTRFEAVVLPGEAQYAPAFGVSVGDMDGDGKEDVFLSQNFFGVDEETTRYDAGRGVWLRGDGRGQFEAVSGQASGVGVYGEGRGSALSDFNADGRLDLAVGQNGAATKLYQNVGAKPGLRVRLTGPPGDPTGAGAVMRLRFGERLGPAREVHAGSGYWSQDGAIQVLGTPEPPTAIWVRWPGGKTKQTEIPPGAREITVDISGQATSQ